MSLDLGVFLMPARRRLGKLRALDVFYLANAGFAAAVTAAVCWPGPFGYQPPGNPKEFALYALVTIFLLGFVWRRVRHLCVPVPLLVAFQLAVFLSLAGGAVRVGATRLDDLAVWGVGFDKLVHLAWAFVGTLGFAGLMDVYARMPAWMRAGASLLVVLGVGAAWEIFEYLAVLSGIGVGVGGYDNNMEDLVADLLGALLALRFPAAWRTLSRYEEPRDGEAG
jgi:hypothetical protein